MGATVAFLSLVALQYWHYCWGAAPPILLVCWHVVAGAVGGVGFWLIVGMRRPGILSKACLTAALWSLLPALSLAAATGDYSISWWTIHDWLLLSFPACFVLTAAYARPRRRGACDDAEGSPARVFVHGLFVAKRMRRPLVKAGAALAAYSLLSVIMTYPGIKTFGSSAIGAGEDIWAYIWSLWWLKRAVFELHQSPYFTDLLFHPSGASLLLHDLQPFNGLLSAPLQSWLGLIPAYNAIQIFNFVSSGLAMYLLAGALTGHAGAAFVAGCAFTFCANHMSHTLEHQGLASLAWLPVYCLAFMKSHTKRGLRWPVLAGVAVILNAGCTWYFMLYAFLLSAIFYGYLIGLEWGRLRWVRWWSGVWQRLTGDGASAYSRLAVGAGGVGLSIALFSACPAVVRTVAVIAVVSLPWFIGRVFGWRCVGRVLLIGVIAGGVLGPVCWQMARRASEFERGHEPWNSATDVVSLLVPAQVSSYGAAFQGIRETFRANHVETGNHLGWAVLALGVAAWAVADRRTIGFWVLLGTVFVALSCGPKITVCGRPVFAGIYWPLRRGAMVLRMAGSPGRMALMGSFALSVMAAYTITWIAGRVRRPVLAFSALLAVILLESLCLPYPVTAAHVPAFYEAMAQDADDYAIVDSAYSRSMFYQTIHGKKLVGGYISRRPFGPLQRIWRVSLLNELLARPVRRTGKMFASPEDVEMLRSQNVRYIIDHSGRYRPVLREQLELEASSHEDRADQYDLRP